MNTSSINGFESNLAKGISYALHPLLIPLYALLLIFRLQTLSVYIIPEAARWLILGMTAISTIAFPILIILLFIRKGLIGNLRMEKQEERMYPCLIVSVIYYVMYLLFQSIKIPGIVSNFFLGVATLMLLALFINLKWKISLHMLAMGGISGTFAGIAAAYELNIVWLVALWLLLSGVAGYARLKLNAHKASEVYFGFLAGAAGMFLLYYLM